MTDVKTSRKESLANAALPQGKEAGHFSLRIVVA